MARSEISQGWTVPYDKKDTNLLFWLLNEGDHLERVYRAGYARGFNDGYAVGAAFVLFAKGAPVPVPSSGFVNTAYIPSSTAPSTAQIQTAGEKTLENNNASVQTDQAKRLGNLSTLVLGALREHILSLSGVEAVFVECQDDAFYVTSVIKARDQNLRHSVYAMEMKVMEAVDDANFDFRVVARGDRPFDDIVSPTAIRL